jgi:hypothetical protein
VNGGSVALVTGASSGIGKAIAERLLADGYVVYAGARRVDRMADLAEMGATAIRMDITRCSPSVVPARAYGSGIVTTTRRDWKSLPHYAWVWERYPHRDSDHTTCRGKDAAPTRWVGDIRWAGGNGRTDRGFRG